MHVVAEPSPFLRASSPLAPESVPMPDFLDLKLLVQSQVPIIVVESREEKRVIGLFERLAHSLRSTLFQWTVTEGLLRMGGGFQPQRFNANPPDVLVHIKKSQQPGIYLLLDFHPYLNDPVNIRHIREIAHNFRKVPHHLIFLSPSFEMPEEIRNYAAKFTLSLPDRNRLIEIIRKVAIQWTEANPGRKVQADKKAVDLLARNLAGLTVSDAARLARNAIFDDGAITKSDMRRVMQAKYELIDQQGVLSFEYETAAFADIGGLHNLKQWLQQRRAVFLNGGQPYGLETPKGLLLLGVQGCGKSLAAKAVAGIWEAPLLRLDFGALYNKYIGETERNLRTSLQTAEVMAPCILWIDEIEKGISVSDSDDGVSRRVLGALLTWMAEKKKPVFIVATANDVSVLPPELLRKGRFDEIFFVDLPDTETRKTIFSIQLNKRRLQPERFDLATLAGASGGFSGAEIEQAVVAALYSALAVNRQVDTHLVLAELKKTRPLSVVMHEKVAALRAWARERTVPAHQAGLP